MKQLPNRLDGEDISTAWFGEQRQRQQALYWKTSSTRSAPAIRVGDWKMHLPRKNRGSIELYDVVKDPGESNNLAMEYPEVVALLRKQLRVWDSELPTEYAKKK
ncbi:MAG: hypothetical protein MK324_03575 [Pirellulales bacterium]|nr:hypothetical protein [Pirellulales bacterium]